METQLAKDLTLLTMEELSDNLKSKSITSRAIVEACLARIDKLDRKGPTLRSIIDINQNALRDAEDRDAEIENGMHRGPLHGIPVLLKDNIESLDVGLATTAGSTALKHNVTGRDAPIVGKLRDQGAVILGKTNMSQWANFRSPKSISGWSSVGGQCKNPHALEYSPMGSSSGSAAAVAAFLAPVAIGTETSGSIIAPASVNGIVGFKPTLGFVSGTHIVPLSSTQDTAGPMARTVRDAVTLLKAIAGSDPVDSATVNANEALANFVVNFESATLNGRKIGVLRGAEGKNKEVSRIFQKVLDKVADEGAEIVEVDEELEANNQLLFLLECEFKDGLNEYLNYTNPDLVPTRTLQDIIGFNERNADVEMKLFGQEFLTQSAKTQGMKSEGYDQTVEDIRRLSRDEGIDKYLKNYKVDLLVCPTCGPAPKIGEPEGGDGIGVCMMAAGAGYPHVTIPMGVVDRKPVGFSIVGGEWRDAEVLEVAYLIEKITQARVDPTFHGDFDNNKDDKCFIL